MPCLPRLPLPLVLTAACAVVFAMPSAATPFVAVGTPALGTPGMGAAAQASSASDEQVWFEDLDAAQADAQASGKPIFVDLWADWCGWCKRLERDVFPHPVFTDYAQRFVLLRLNTDSDDGAEIQARYRTYSLPTALLLSPQLVEMGRVEGYVQAPAYVGMLKAQLRRWEQAQERRAWQAESDDPRVLLQLARELHELRDGGGAAEVYQRLLTLSDKTETELDPAWLQLMLSDAQRLAGDFEAAIATLERGHRQASSDDNSELLQAVDLLRIQIAHDRQDCTAARLALETFLRTYPQSPHRRQARDSLRALEQGRADCS